SGDLLNRHFGLTDRILSVALSASGQLAAGSTDGMIRVWDPARTSEAHRFRADPQYVSAVAFHPKNDGQLASAGRDGRLRFWNTGGGLGGYQVLPPPLTECAAMSPDGRFVATASKPTANRGGLNIWKVEAVSAGRLHRALPDPGCEVLHLSFSP